MSALFMLFVFVYFSHVYLFIFLLNYIVYFICIYKKTLPYANKPSIMRLNRFWAILIGSPYTYTYFVFSLL